MDYQHFHNVFQEYTENISFYICYVSETIFREIYKHRQNLAYGKKIFLKVHLTKK